MKKLTILMISVLTAFILYSCGGNTATVVKPEDKTVKKDDKAGYDKMNDTAFANVMSVLRESLENERSAGDSSSKLQTAKAYILVIKFLKTDKDKVKKSGMSDADISFIASDAKDKASARLKEIQTSQTAPQTLKDEATMKLKDLETL
jgi:hypothetical protein